LFIPSTGIQIMIVVTGATGQLGRLVIQSLLAKVPAAQIIAAVRQPTRAADLAALGVQVRQADYSQPATLDAAFQGASKLLLISSSELGQRAAQHRNVIEAAQRAGVSLVAYTSLLHADRSPLGLAGEHVQTEALLKTSGLPHVLLRNGWYTENYLASVPARPARSMSWRATAPTPWPNSPPSSACSQARPFPTSICPRPSTRPRCSARACPSQWPSCWPTRTSAPPRAGSLTSSGSSAN
jgi:uncharacterized protein YbjT (DUF2867 family)